MRNHTRVKSVTRLLHRGPHMYNTCVSIQERGLIAVRYATRHSSEKQNSECMRPSTQICGSFRVVHVASPSRQRNTGRFMRLNSIHQRHRCTCARNVGNHSLGRLASKHTHAAMLGKPHISVRNATRHSPNLSS